MVLTETLGFQVSMALRVAQQTLLRKNAACQWLKLEVGKEVRRPGRAQHHLKLLWSAANYISSIRNVGCEVVSEVHAFLLG